MADFEFLVLSDKVIEKFDKMLERVERLDVEMRFTAMDWQRDDLNRDFPAVDVGNNTVSMTIPSRSRTWARRKKILARRARAQKQRRQRGRFIKKGGARPILRPLMFDKLCERMREMMKDKLQWR